MGKKASGALSRISGNLYLYGAYESGTAPVFQFTTPVWVLWYLLSLTLWYAVSNALNPAGRAGLLTLGVALAAALLCGFDRSVGYSLSLSRTIVLFPFFWCGVYIRANSYDRFEQFVTRWDKPTAWLKVAVAVVSLAGLAGLWHLRHSLPFNWFYHAMAYNEDGYTVAVRAGILGMAAVFTLLLLILIPKRQIPLVTRIGKHTLPILVLHGILVRYLAHIGCLQVPSSYALPFVLLLTAAMVLVLSSAPVVWLFRLPSLCVGLLRQRKAADQKETGT